jgi:hypothetical protein
MSNDSSWRKRQAKYNGAQMKGSRRVLGRFCVSGVVFWLSPQPTPRNRAVGYFWEIPGWGGWGGGYWRWGSACTALRAAFCRTLGDSNRGHCPRRKAHPKKIKDRQTKSTSLPNAGMVLISPPKWLFFSVFSKGVRNLASVARVPQPFWYRFHRS